MTSRFIFLFLLSFIFNNSYSENQELTKNDTASVKGLLTLLDKYQNTNLDSAIEICNNYLDTAEQTNNNYLKAKTLYYLGGVYDMKGEFEKASDCYFRSLSIFEKLNDKRGIGGCLNCIGVILWEQSDQVMLPAKQIKLRKSIEYLDKALKYYKDVDFKNGIGIVYMNKGIVFNDSGNYSHDFQNTKSSFNKAVEFYKKAIDIFYKTGETGRIADCNLNIALLKYDIFLKSNDTILSKEEYLEIESYLKKALSGFNKINDFYGQSMVLKNLATIKIKYSDNLNKKNPYLNDALDLAYRSLQYADSLKALFLKYDAYYEIYKASKRLGNYQKALKFHELYTNTRDSVYEAKRFKVMEEMEKRYDTEKKEQLIAMQKKQNRQQRFIIIGILFLLGLIIILIFVLYRFYKQKTSANRELNAINAELNRLNATQNKLISIISHDLKAPVSAFFSITNSLKSNIGKLTPKEIEYYIGRMYNSSLALKIQFENILQWALSQARGIKAEKKHINLSVVVAKVVMAIEEFAIEKGITIENNVNQNIEFNTDPKLLNIVLNNLITNAIKFSHKNSKVEIAAFGDNGKITIKVKDSGIGMSPEDAANLFTGKGVAARNENRGTGLGLIVSKEIVEKLGGNIRVESKLNKGTTFYIDLYE